MAIDETIKAIPQKGMRPGAGGNSVILGACGSLGGRISLSDTGA
jgi:hypothetical protein